jgi:hypothetical protein
MITWSTTNRNSEAVLELLDSTPTSGQVRLSTHRPHGLDASLCVEGRRRDVLTASHQPDNLVVGVGIRSEKDCYIDGRHEPECVGYLSALRVREGYRRGLLLGRGYQVLHDLHRKGNAKYYLTTIMADNQTAMNLLASGRAGLPIYQDWGEIRTLLMNARMPSQPEGLARGDISEMSRNDIEEVVRFLSKEGPRRQFFPAYRVQDFDSADGLLAGLAMSDVLLARDDKGLAGCAGVWDQSHFKSWNIAGYNFPFSALRQIHNLWARFRNLPSWPEPGRPMNIRFLSLFCVRGDDMRIGRRLLQSALHLAYAREADILAWSLHERDPLQLLSAGTAGIVLKSRLFLAYWPQELGPSGLPSMSLPPYLETGAL